MEKIEIARRELGAALQLFLDDKCPVSVHVLASAGAEVVEGLVQYRGGKPLLDMVLVANPEYTKRDANDALRKFANAFKHLSKKDGKLRDDAAIIEKFNDEENVAILFKGWLDYGNVEKRLPIEAQLFQLWVLARMGLLKGKIEPFNQVKTLPYKEAKALLRAAPSIWLDNPDILASDTTEVGPLMRPPP
jgi:hypothetical protein